jgi:hypothetical protein
MVATPEIQNPVKNFIAAVGAPLASDFSFSASA